MLVILLISLVYRSNHTKSVLFSYQICMIQLTFINLHSNGYSQDLHSYPPVVKLDRCVWSCNNLNDLPNKVCVPSKTEDLNIYVFNMITGKNESKTLKKKKLNHVNVNVNMMEESVI